MTQITKDFVPYEEALDLKELGFDGDCFGIFYETSKEFRFSHVTKSGKMLFQNNVLWKSCGGVITRPTFSQAFRWFREKHGLFVELKCCNTKRINGTFEIEISRLNDRVYGHYGYETYEEAELACLKKIIEIVKQK